MGSYKDSSYRGLSDSHIETTSHSSTYQCETNIKVLSEPSSAPSDPASDSVDMEEEEEEDDTLNEELASLRLAAARQTSVKEVIRVLEFIPIANLPLNARFYPPTL
jgi:hypothetical protein